MTTTQQRILLVMFGLTIGVGIAGGAWWLLRPPSCEPEQAAGEATGAISYYKMPCDNFLWDLAEPGLPNHTIRQNNLGMHDEIVTFEKAPGTFRVLVLGDSYVQGLQVPLEQGFVDLLETRLNREYRQPVEVINLGVDTIGTDRVLMLYSVLGYRFDADVVLLATYVGNDVQNNSIEMARLRNEGYSPRPFFKLDAAGNLRLYNWTQPLPQDDHPAPVWLRRAQTQQPFVIVTPPAPVVVQQAPYELEYPVQLGLYLPEDDYWAEAWQITDAVLAQFAGLTAATDTPFGVLVIPDRRTVHVEDYRRTIERYPFIGTYDPGAAQERMVTLSEAHGIPTLDLLPVLFSAEQNGDRAYLELDGHYNALGHELTAGAVYDWMVENGFVPQ
ncbi:MAG: hypothetical protein AAFR56_04135 [Chloroflexota bacterium]